MYKCGVFLDLRKDRFIPHFGYASPFESALERQGPLDGFGNQRGLCTVDLGSSGESEILLLRGSHVSTLTLESSAKAVV